MWKLSLKNTQENIRFLTDHILDDFEQVPALSIDAFEISPGQFWCLEILCENEDTGQALLDLITETTEQQLPISLTPLKDKDWVALSLEGLPSIFMPPFVIGGAHTLDALPNNGLRRLQIEAGMAFGTGHHGTTLGCLKAFGELSRKKRFKSVLDLGSGTGILAIAAARMGAASIYASDIDIEAINVIKDNMELNKIQKIRPLKANGVNHEALRAAAPFDLIFANILMKPLIAMAPDITKLLAPDGHLILSGILNYQRPLTQKAYTARGLKYRKRYRKDGWTALVLQK